MALLMQRLFKILSSIILFSILFTFTPIVISGVLKDSADIILKNRSSVTGVYEAIDPEETMHAAMKMMSDINEVFIINDNSESGTETGKITKNVLRSINGKLILHDLSSHSIRDILNKVASLNKNSIVIIDKKSVFFGFDYVQLKKFHIPLKSLPTGSRIINNPFNFFENNKTMIFSIMVVFLFLVGVISVLSININSRKKAGTELRKKHEELTVLCGETTESGEMFRENFSELMQKQKELSVSEERYRLVVGSTKDIIWEGDLVNKKQFFSEKLFDILGYRGYELEEFDDWFKLIHPEDYDRVIKNFQHINEEKIELSSLEYRVRCRDGNYKWLLFTIKQVFNDKGLTLRVVGAFTDISELKEQQRKIYHLAYHNSVTGLPNRIMLRETVDREVTGDKGYHNQFALLYIDLDNFKEVNDSFGHRTGDQILYLVGQRLKEVEKEECRVFNLGGDEFIILLKDPENRLEVEAFSQNLLQNLFIPFIIDGNVLNGELLAG